MPSQDISFNDFIAFHQTFNALFSDAFANTFGPKNSEAGLNRQAKPTLPVDVHNSCKTVGGDTDVSRLL